MYQLNDGKLIVYKKKSTKSKIGTPIDELIFFMKFYFSYIGTFTDEYYSSKQKNIKIEDRVRILQCRDVAPNDVIVIGGKQFEVGRVCHAVNKSGIPVTDITLEKVVAVYDIGGV